MNVLVINCGSSSIKAAIIEHESGKRLANLHIERIGSEQATVRYGRSKPIPTDARDHASALRGALPQLLETVSGGIAAVGHRVVHGGSLFSQPTAIDDAVEKHIDALAALAPLHNPANLAGIRAARAVLPELPHVAVFDTAFHNTLPRRARAYAINKELANRHQLYRYGFHGTSHRYVAQRAAELLNEPLDRLRIVTCHLGNGASACAIEYGRSVETSMGTTPLEGLVMGTRSGDLDPGLMLQLMRAEKLSVDEMDELLNRRSGLAGLSGQGNDMRDIEKRAGEGDEDCQLALHVFCHRLRKYIGAYAAVMGGIDAIVFTGGIGENSALIRHRVAQRLEFLGAQLDEERNRAVRVRNHAPTAVISQEHSRTQILVVATDEEHAIAQQCAHIADAQHLTQGDRNIPIAISARHIHLTTKTIEALFGEGYQLRPRNELSQPHQFACEETLDLIGPKRTLKSVRVLGPPRGKNQVEISRTDEFFLGIDAPVRNSGDVRGSAGITLRGPAGSITLEEGVICARRHIHMTPDDAKHFGVKDKDIVDVAVDSSGRDLVFGDVLIRVSKNYRLEMHIDTDEGNAAELTSGQPGLLVSTNGNAKLSRKRQPAG